MNVARPASPRPMPRRRLPLLLVVALVALVSLGSASGAAPVAGAPSGSPATGAPPPPGFGQPGIPVRPASERYVRDAYQAVLGRAADSAGLSYWGGRLDGGTTRATFARQLILSREALTATLTPIYALIGDAPSADGYAALREGSTVEEILVAILDSSEYYDQAGGTDEEFVAALYQDLLGRAPNQVGDDYWVGRLADGAAQIDVARGFVYSRERLSAQVTDSYDRILARAADAAGRDYWVGRIRRGLGILNVDRHLLAGGEAWGMGCSILDRTRCLLPFPNDELTLPDASTDTGRRLVFKPPWVPAPVGGPAFNPQEWNRQDGFSPGSAILVHNAGIDPATSGLPPLTDIAASLEPDSPIVIVDTETGDRWPFWAELDANAPNAAERALALRPARNFLDGHTYAVGIGPMRTASGGAVAATPGFRIFRDEIPSPNRRDEERRPGIEAAIDAVTAAGLERDTLHLAWTFTVASTRNLAERAILMRDEVLSGPQGEVPADFTVTSTEPNEAEQTTRVEGTYDVPKYLTGSGAPGSRLNLGSDSLPQRSGDITVPFVCTVPDSARATPARPSLYGHGLFGTGDQAAGGYVRAVTREHNMVYCGTDWLGMSESDLPNTIGIVQDLSQFPELVDRTQQAFLDFMVLGRLMTLPDGFATDPAFQGDGDAPVIDGSQLYYDGISQGGIMGGALVALSTDITRGALGVPAMNYSTLLERSVDFDPFFSILAPKYPSALDRIIMISMIQMLWDRGEANGYANHLTADPLPGTPTHEVLMHVAFGDHQVAPIAADVEARTIEAATNDPPLDDGRLADVTPLYGIDRIETFPHAGSAIVYWDSGTPAPPIENLPNRAGDDPHGDPRSDPDAREQISEFLRPDGVVVDVCGGSFCVADGQ